MSDLLRTLPSVDRLLGEPALAAVPRPLRVRAIQETLDAVRVELRTGKLDALPDLVARVRGRADALVAPSVRPVINATGVVLHTNSGGLRGTPTRSKPPRRWPDGPRPSNSTWRPGNAAAAPKASRTWCEPSRAPKTR